jgi:hypothetical protein
MIETSFDTEFIRDVRWEGDLPDETDVTFSYDLRDIQASFPAVVSEAFFAVKLTNENLFPSTIIYIDEPLEDDTSYLPYIVDGTMEYGVELTAQEKTRLLLFLVKQFGARADK